MNKKFSTLVAGFLLATNVGAYADVTPTAITAIDMAVTGAGIELATYVSTSTDPGFISYKVGQAYYLSAAAGSGSESVTDLLSMNDEGELILSNSLATFDDSERSLWILKSISAPAGAVAPKYVFENKKTGAVLAVDKSKAVALADIDQYTPAVKVGGTTSEWLASPSYTKPGKDNPLYAALEEDEVITFVKDATSGNIVLAKMTKAEMADATANNILVFTPRQLKAGKSTFVLSPKDLNTMLGKAGDKATQNNYFQLSFAPTATTNGKDNIWGYDLQAVAVEQFDVLYGQDASKVLKVVVPPATNTDSPLSVTGGGPVADADVTPGGVYTSLRPLWDAEGAADQGKNLTVNYLTNEGATDAVNNADGRWVTLRNREGKYLVVDTAYVPGTEQNGTGLVTFAWDKLYNSHNDTRLRDPRSYLFQFQYNPVTNEVTIQSYNYVSKCAKDGQVTEVTTDPATWYAADYADAFVKQGSEWFTADVDPVNTWIRRALLGSTSEVTLTEDATAPTVENQLFKITLGNSGQLVETSVSTGAYLIKVVGSTDPTRVGKYWINNLDGSFTIMEQATRQNFQHMPAAQWIVKSTGAAAGSPVLSITNREFQKTLGAADFDNQFTPAGTLFVGANGGKYFMNGDELQFIPVTNVADDKLGYKYVANDTIRESLFTFNYLHELAMNKPVNTLNDKDSVVWVDTKGDKMSFVLEAIADDTYGTNGEVTGIADLNRRAYRIKVNDASKLQNDGRYLTYDAKQKKYIVSTKDTTLVDIFFLKENNEVNGGNCYYTLLQANVMPVVKVSDVAGANQVTNRIGYMTLDADATSAAIGDEGELYLAEYGKYTSEKDGIVNGTEGWAIRTFSKIQADAYAKEHGLIAPGAGSPFVIIDDNAGNVAIKGINDEFKEIAKTHYVLKLTVSADEDGDYPAANYATSKVSVDNNTLALVNGNLSDNSANEVANSAFAVVRDADPLYRYFATTDTLKFYRTNAAAPEYLYEDAYSKYSKGLEFNFLGVEGKGDNANAAMYLDTAYVNRGTRMPQYLIALEPTIVTGDTILCDASTHSHATMEDALACPHTKITPSYVDARYLVNLQDSVDYYAGNADLNLRGKYQYDRAYTRLGFVDARHIGDTLVIKNSAYTGDTRPLVAGFPATYASKDSIYLGNNMHKNAVFSFRIAKSGSDDFLIESETEGQKANSSDFEHKKNADLKSVRIAPNMGGWVKIQNGVPVIANNGVYNESGRDADIFNVEQTEENPTANDETTISNVEVIAVNGGVVVKNATAKNVVISNMLGQTLANKVIVSDSETISLPAGIVIVAVEGEAAVKAIVK